MISLMCWEPWFVIRSSSLQEYKHTILHSLLACNQCIQTNQYTHLPSGCLYDIYEFICISKANNSFHKKEKLKSNLIKPSSKTNIVNNYYLQWVQMDLQISMSIPSLGNPVLPHQCHCKQTNVTIIIDSNYIILGLPNVKVQTLWNGTKLSSSKTFNDPENIWLALAKQGTSWSDKRLILHLAPINTGGIYGQW